MCTVDNLFKSKGKPGKEGKLCDPDIIGCYSERTALIAGCSLCLMFLSDIEHSSLTACKWPHALSDNEPIITKNYKFHATVWGIIKREANMTDYGLAKKQNK